jgi:hypothetical protein
VSADTLPLPLSLAGVTVTVGGLAAPLFAVADLGGYQQINFQVPREDLGLSGGAVTVVVSQNAQQGTVAVAPADNMGGAFFRIGSTQYGVFQHASDYSVVTSDNPARPGEFLIAYVTGLPPATPAVSTGEAAPLSPLSTVKMAYPDARDPLPSSHYMSLVIKGASDFSQVTLTDPENSSGDVTGESPISFIGLVPGSVGLYQINFVMPQVSAGDATIWIEWSRCTSHFIYTCPATGYWSRNDSQPVLMPVGK